MTKKRSSKPKKEVQPSLRFPSLHQDIADAVQGDIGSTWYNDDDDDCSFNNEYTTHVMGKFICNNRGCSTNGWSSKMVAIVIKGYTGNGYSAEVFKQRCKACSRLGSLILDKQSYVERVAYRLKKWAGVPMEKRYYFKKEGPPHVSWLCEGCKRGVCRQDVD